MKKALVVDAIREIKNNFKRFLSILLIVLLGVGFFAGIKATSPDMKQTIDSYFDEKNVFDFEVLSTIGLNDSDIEKLKEIEQVNDVIPSFSSDAICHIGDMDVVVKINTILDNVNQLHLIEGDMPKNQNECVVEKGFLTKTGYNIGDTISLKVEDTKDENGNDIPFLKENETKIVGVIESPLYISRTRGSSKLGSGVIQYYLYIPKELVNSKIYTEAYITLEGTKELQTGSKEYDDKIEEIKQKIEELASIRKEERYSEIKKDAEDKLKEAQNTLNTEKEKAQKEISDAENKIKDAKDKINDIKRPDWYILTRDENVGYVSYMQDTERIANIGKVFPVVFFVVAALISLTSMTRMVEEQRVQIGTLKAIGYNKLQIASKYIIYAALATVIGSLIGVTIGFNLLPKIIFDIYKMMYTLPDINAEFNLYYTITGTGIAILCTVGATIYSCSKELISMPAVLMRPKSPKMGKRVFLENIKFIWSKLKFTQKVTARNIFRYKKRFLMTIIGVCGCTSLIVAGFGLRDSVSHMIPSQYGRIFKYNITIGLKDSISREDISKKTDEVSQYEDVLKVLKINKQSIDIIKNDNNQDVQLVVPENIKDLEEFIALQSRKNESKYILEDDSVIITEKIADLLDIKEGDIIKIKNTDDIEANVKVGKITENYLYHYIYMSPNLYKNLYDEEVKYNQLIANTKEMTKDEEELLGKQILEDKDLISSVEFTSAAKDLFSDVMDNMNLVVWILIVSAGLLAFVVLYNLSNVNISERIRELASLKVLGFYDKEVYEYIAKETIILTVIGMGLGLFAGYFLNFFIMQTCELDMFMFDKRVNLTSYIYAILLTVFFSIIVNIATYFALKKIDMIESLKSVE